MKCPQRALWDDTGGGEQDLHRTWQTNQICGDKDQCGSGMSCVNTEEIGGSSHEVLAVWKTNR